MPYATLTARMATVVLAPYAGRIALMILASAMMELTAISLMRMVVEPVRSIQCKVAKSSVLSGTPSATMTSIMSAAASARLTALRR